jgi:hypothetical protein
VSFPSYPNAFTPDQRWWEIANERWRQYDALTRVGEWAMFILLWTIRDHEAGLAEPCPNCSKNLGANAQMIQDIYRQPTDARCPVCLGAFYVGPAGGVKAKLIRPSIWQWGEEQLQYLERGTANVESAQVTTTGDFRMEPRDFIFRGDGRRFQVSNVQVSHLASGFGTQASTDTAIGAVYNVAEENQNSPAYLVSPDAQGLMEILNPAYSRQAPDFTDIQFADGPVKF